MHDLVDYLAESRTSRIVSGSQACQASLQHATLGSLDRILTELSTASPQNVLARICDPIQCNVDSARVGFAPFPFTTKLHYRRLGERRDCMGWGTLTTVTLHSRWFEGSALDSPSQHYVFTRYFSHIHPAKVHDEYTGMTFAFLLDRYHHGAAVDRR